MFCLFYLGAIDIEVALGLRERKGRKLKRAKKLLTRSQQLTQAI
ncbi:hypothetical protein BQ1740_3184 [Bacillus subtilis]|nr:hypothetical protein BQ1740_3184 [Bacillus subtilis]